MRSVMSEIGQLRRELRDLKNQRDRDQAVIEQLRRIVDDGVPDLPIKGPQPAVAAPTPSWRS